MILLSCVGGGVLLLGRLLDDGGWGCGWGWGCGCGWAWSNEHFTEVHSPSSASHSCPGPLPHLQPPPRQTPQPQVHLCLYRPEQQTAASCPKGAKARVTGNFRLWPWKVVSGLEAMSPKVMPTACARRAFRTLTRVLQEPKLTDRLMVTEVRPVALLPGWRCQWCVRTGEGRGMREVTEKVHEEPFD